MKTLKIFIPNENVELFIEQVEELLNEFWQRLDTRIQESDFRTLITIKGLHPNEIEAIELLELHV